MRSLHYVGIGASNPTLIYKDTKAARCAGPLGTCGDGADD
jgi:hypothetical protein